ncbi:MAG: KH domain-containing protein [Actinobacteria bacterium]|nr:KH domain-containing protein [Actinomycetota bacterium]
MPDSRNLDEAINLYIKSLEEEQRNGKLIEGKKIGSEGENLTGVEKIASFVKKVVEFICLGEEVKVKIDPDANKISVYGTDLGIAIGRAGKNLQALEYIVNLIARRKRWVSGEVVIDIKNYKERKFEKLKKIALRMAKKAIEEGKKIALKPMSSYERKIVHGILSEIKNVKTRSKNKEPNRRIVIYPLKEKDAT